MVKWWWCDGEVVVVWWCCGGGGVLQVGSREVHCGGIAVKSYIMLETWEHGFLRNGLKLFWNFFLPLKFVPSLMGKGINTHTHTKNTYERFCTKTFINLILHSQFH